jgi:hypothetical protein
LLRLFASHKTNLKTVVEQSRLDSSLFTTTISPLWRKIIPKLMTMAAKPAA